MRTCVKVDGLNYWVYVNWCSNFSWCPSI